MTILFWLLVGHSIADYPLQGDFLARGKNHRAPLPGVPWWICLVNHAAIHAGAVAIATDSFGLALAEFFWHVVIDFSKSQGWFGEGEQAFTIDQALHVACKVVWAAGVAAGFG